METDAVDNAAQFLGSDDEDIGGALRKALQREVPPDSTFKRYRANMLVDRSELTGAPVVFEDNPTHANLVGRVEHETQFGALITDFTLIRAGALHRAIGGYLVLDAIKVLQNPFAWESLKRTLRAGEIKIESLGHSTGLLSTVSLEPEPIPLGDTEVILCGERRLYYLLSALDPDFLELFKVLVDFDTTLDRRPGDR